MGDKRGITAMVLLAAAATGLLLVPIPEALAAVVLVSVTCLCALSLAYLLRLDERLATLVGAGSGAREPEQIVEELRRCAEHAAQFGIASLAGFHAAAGCPGLRHGLRLAAAGGDAESIQRVLEERLDRMLERRARGGEWWMDLARAAVPVGGAMIAVCSAAAILLLDRATPMPVWLAGTAFVGMLGGLSSLTIRPLSGDELTARESAEILAATMVARGIAAIAAGHPPREVEREVRAVLPGSTEVVEARRAA